MAVSAQSIIDYNKIVQVRDARLRGQQIATGDDGLVSFLLSDANRNAQTAFPLSQGRRLLTEALMGKQGKTAVFKVLPRFNPRLESYGANFGTNECDFSGSEQDKLVAAQLTLSDRIIATETFNPDLCANELEFDEQLANAQRRLYEKFNYQLSAFVVKELTRKQGGKFVHIGNSPARDADSFRPAGSGVNIFKADGETPNPAGAIQLQQELTVANVGTDGMVFGGAKWDAYRRLISGFSQGNAEGFVYNSVTLPFLNNAQFMMSPALNTYFNQQGIDDPLLIIKLGALQLLTVARWENSNLQGVFGLQERRVITVPGFGVTADLTINKEICDDYPVWKFKLEVRAALWSEPSCLVEINNDNFRNGYNEVLLYSGKCADQAICDIEEITMVTNSVTQPIADCTPTVTVCDAPTTCSVTIKESYNPDGSLILSAFATPVPPDTVTLYEWKRNGNPVQTSANPQLILDAADWANGDKFTVAIVTTSGCTAEAEVALDAPYPMLQLFEDAVPYASGSTVSITEAKGAGNIVTTINLASLSSTNVDVSSITVSNVGTITIATAPTTPATPTTIIKPTAQDIVLTTPKTNAGTVTYYITVNSNDINTPVYELVVEITVTN